MKSVTLRVSEEFRKKINEVRAKGLLLNAQEISCEKISRALIKYIDWDKVWQQEFAKRK